MSYPHLRKYGNFYAPTINNIPSVLINEQAKIVEVILDEITTSTTEDSINGWEKMFMVARCVYGTELDLGKVIKGKIK